MYQLFTSVWVLKTRPNSNRVKVILKSQRSKLFDSVISCFLSRCNRILRLKREKLNLLICFWSYFSFGFTFSCLLSRSRKNHWYHTTSCSMPRLLVQRKSWWKLWIQISWHIQPTLFPAMLQRISLLPSKLVTGLNWPLRHISFLTKKIWAYVSPTKYYSNWILSKYLFF